MDSKAETSQQVADTAEEVVASVRETTYSHHNHVDAGAGVFDVDCNGFVGYVLKHAAPEHYAEIPKEPGHLRPRAFKYYEYFSSPPDADSGWGRVLRLADAHRGDVIAWRLTEQPERDKNTGHVLIVADDPRDEGDDVLSVGVIDSSDVRHYDDSRGQGGDGPATGVGTGRIHFRVDEEGRPTEYQFGPGDRFHERPIAIGRLESPDR